MERKARAMERCCTSASVSIVWKEGKPSGRLDLWHCDDRLCPFCAAHRTRTARKRLAFLLDSARHPKLVTLTQRAIPGETWRTARGRLTRAWHRFWRKESGGWFRGGVRRIETTWSKSGAWHVHLHVLCETHGTMPQAEISERWQRAGGGPIVDVRRAYSPRELVKYACKAANLPLERIAEYRLTAFGSRDLQTFGSWFGVPLPDEDPADDVEARDLEALIRLADQGDANAAAVVAAVKGQVDLLVERSSRREAGREKRDTVPLAPTLPRRKGENDVRTVPKPARETPGFQLPCSPGGGATRAPPGCLGAYG